VRYNHACSIAFEVITEAKGEHITGLEIRNALTNKLRNYSNDDLIEAVGLPFDTFELNEDSLSSSQKPSDRP
jgi:hypothetical protein